MRTLLKIILGIVGLLTALLVIGWLGLRIRPDEFPAYPERAATFTTVPLPDDLPEPVRRYYQALFGDEIPMIDSAIITLTGDLRFVGITFPGNLRFSHNAGRDYRHYIEATMFGRPLMQVDESFLDNHSVLELPFGTVSDEPKIDSAANLGLWGESIWLPSIFITDARVRWEAIDETSARLIVPFGDTGEEDEFICYFDPATGLLVQAEAMRWKETDSTEKTRWILEVYGWEEFEGMLVPSPAAVTWEDEGTPWLVASITDLAYNVDDIAAYLRQKGL